MKRIMVVVLVLKAAVSGWSQMTTIEFVTKDGLPVPVWEITGAASGGNINAGFYQPAFMAPVTVDVANGWHRYRIGNKGFDVVADGIAQSWNLNPGHPVWASVGLCGGAIGAGIVLGAGIPYMLSPDYRSTGIAITAGGAAIVAGGIVLYYTMRPTARRIH
jgi:hypothetical protein